MSWTAGVVVSGFLLLKLLVPTVSFVVRMLMEKVVVLFVEEVR